MGATERHARDDCNEAIPKATKEMRMSSHFAKKAGKSNSGTTKECGTYDSQPLHAAAAACIADEECVGFTAQEAKDGESSPNCLLVDFGEDGDDPAAAVYIKVKDQAGNNVRGGIFEFYNSTAA